MGSLNSDSPNSTGRSKTGRSIVLDMLASDVPEEEILEDYQHLTKEDIQACLRYAARSCKNEIYVELESVAA
ncbi:MAG: DUF433 domain-containing protein [Thermodesulfobacteriota bacterium]|nr:DUF433 domain-containing protein [Thermodesulfobacteriota bacterium]